MALSDFSSLLRVTVHVISVIMLGFSNCALKSTLRCDLSLFRVQGWLFHPCDKIVLRVRIEVEVFVLARFVTGLRNTASI